MSFKTLKVKYTSLVLFQLLLDLSFLLGVEFLKLNNQVSDNYRLSSKRPRWKESETWIPEIPTSFEVRKFTCSHHEGAKELFQEGVECIFKPIPVSQQLQLLVIITGSRDPQAIVWNNTNFPHYYHWIWAPPTVRCSYFMCHQMKARMQMKLSQS